jgi:hypothetical protein
LVNSKTTIERRDGALVFGSEAEGAGLATAGAPTSSE